MELGGVPDNALAHGGAEDREQYKLVVRRFEQRVTDRRHRARAFGLHLLEYRRLIEAQANPEGEQQQKCRTQERNAPAPSCEVCRQHFLAHDVNHNQCQEEAQRCRGLNPARRIAAAAVAGVFGHISGSTTIFAADGQALNEAQKQEKDRSKATDRCISWQAANQEGRNAHHDDGDQKCVFATEKIADAAKEQRAKGAHDKTCG